VDRPPFPLPAHVDVPIYFTNQPGGAYVYTAGKRKGPQLVYPNYRHLAKGSIARFLHYDPDQLDWYVYGWGTVGKTQVVPSADTRLYSFTGAMFDTGMSPPGGGPTPGGKPDGDPVDLATGLFVLQKTDLYEPVTERRVTTALVVEHLA
jgi:hypothetical protein